MCNDFHCQNFSSAFVLTETIFCLSLKQRKRDAEGSDEDKEDTPSKQEKKKSKKDKKKSKEKEKESSDEVSTYITVHTT